MQPDQLDSDLKPGDLLQGKYRILHQIGAGGFGKVYAAENTNLGTRVAIKVRRSSKRDDRIWREGKAAARLRSPHTVRVFDVDRLDDGTAYMVMEFLEGQSLREHLARSGPVGVPQAVTWMLELCAALREAHAINLIHRDIKPSNIFLVEGPNVDPHIKLVDFGLAKAFGEPVEESVTESGLLVGSPAYMSPEQVRSARLSPQTDIWSLGVVLYEVISGLRPFHGTGSAGMLAAIAADQPAPLSEVAPHAAPELDRIVAKCLRKTESERFASVDELSAALRKLEIASGPRPTLNGGSGIPDSQGETRTSSSAGLLASVNESKPKEGIPGWVAAALGLLLLTLALWLRPSATLSGVGSSTAPSPLSEPELMQQATTERAPRQAKPSPATTSSDAPLAPAKPPPAGAAASAPALDAGQRPAKQAPDTKASTEKPAASSLQAGFGHPDGAPSASPPGLFVEPDF
jgi:eukaryotic-like serine/threonine-protein kinase